MKRFSFQLQPLLEMRVRTEEAALLELADANRAHHAAAKRLSALETEISHALRPRATDPRDMARLQVYLESLEMRKVAVAAELAERAYEMEIKRQQAATAQAERKALERLRERRQTEWRSENEKAESRALDEVAVTQAHQRLSQEETL